MSLAINLRLCAVGLHLDVGRATDPACFVAGIADVLDRWVVAHPEGATLVVLPEHTGLLAMLTDPRAELARARLSDGSPIQEVLAGLAFGYREVLAALAARFPCVQHPGQLLHLAVTDTLRHALVDGLGRLARDRGWWVAVGTALADVEPVDGELAALFGGPTAGDRRVYGPRSPEVRNRTLLLGPDGALAAVQDKVHLVDAEQRELGLAPADLAAVTVADLPIGRVASVISKDAWMPDVNERLDQLDAEVLLQPEAFDRWTEVDRGPVTDDGPQLADLWPPDKLQRGGWWMLRRHRAPVVNATAVLLGGWGGLGFDGQATIATAAPGAGPRTGLAGQPPDVGWGAVGPWWASSEPPQELADPGRRAQLEQLGRQPTRAPQDHAVWVDLDLPRRAPVAAEPVARTAPDSVEVAPGRMQLVPDLLAEGDAVRVVWVEVGPDGGQRVIATLGDGRRWDAPRPVFAPDPPLDPTRDRWWRPRLAVGIDGPWCLALGFPAGSWDLVAAPAAGEPGRAQRVDDADRVESLRRERGHDAPRLRHDGAGLLAVWSDLRWPWVLPQVRLAHRPDRTGVFSASRRVDGGDLQGQPDPLGARSPAETRGQTAPDVVVVPDGLVVVWQELGPDGWPAVRGLRLGPGPEFLPDGPPRWLVTGIHGAYRPALAAHGAQVWLVAEQVASDGSGGLVVRCSPDGGRTFAPVSALDPSRPSGTRQRAAAVVVEPSAAGVDRPGATPTVSVVLEDDRTGGSAILAVGLDASGRVLSAQRVDDAPPDAVARAPAAVRTQHGDLVVVWQDTRGGSECLRSIRLART